VSRSGLDGTYTRYLPPILTRTYLCLRLRHVRSEEYPEAGEDYTLEYVEM
jgi:hypothetical protein